MRCPRCDGVLLNDDDISCLNCGWCQNKGRQFSQAEGEADRAGYGTGKKRREASHGYGRGRIKM